MTQVWRKCWRQDPAGTERLAREESQSKLTDNAIIVACFASLAAVVVALGEASHAQDPASIAAVVLGVLGTMVAWALVNTVYALKYARMFFLDHRGGHQPRDQPRAELTSQVVPSGRSRARDG